MGPDPERDDVTADLAAAMRDASLSIRRRELQAKVVDASMAARASYHALTYESNLAPMPAGLALAIVQMAFASAWNELSA